MAGIHLHRRTLSRLATFAIPQAANLFGRYSSEPTYLKEASGQVVEWLDETPRGIALRPNGQPPTVETVGGLRYVTMPASNGGFLSSYDAFPNGSSYTFLARIRQPELQDNACIFGTPGGHALIARSGGTELGVYTNTYAVQAAHNVPAGQFYNVAMDYDAATNLTRLWVNNVLLGQGQGNGPNMGEYAILFLNTYSYGSFPARSLQYGEVVLYNTILSDSSRATWHAYLLTR